MLKSYGGWWWPTGFQCQPKGPWFLVWGQGLTKSAKNFSPGGEGRGVKSGVFVVFQAIQSHIFKTHLFLGEKGGTPILRHFGPNFINFATFSKYFAILQARLNKSIPLVVTLFSGQIDENSKLGRLFFVEHNVKTNAAMYKMVLQKQLQAQG